jgi:hypothetical protein
MAILYELIAGSGPGATASISPATEPQPA